MTKQLTRLFLSIVAVLFLFTVSQAQADRYYAVKGVALKGYDPVAYFTLGKATKGVDSFTTTWSGAVWKFVSAEHLQRFRENPESYAPQFGGYCAFGCSENHLSPTDPSAWTIVDNKLYLNYNADVKKLWLKDTTGRISLANQYWPALHK